MTVIVAAVAGLVASCGLPPRRAFAADVDVDRSPKATAALDHRNALPPAPATLDSFALVVLPDTQYYAAAHPEILEAQTQWIVRERAALGIAAVLHEGDIVDEDEAGQWERAARSLHELDGVVPYILSVGNHDYRRAGGLITRDSQIDDYFSPATFARSLWFKGTFEPGRIENSFEIVEPPGGPWLILSLEFGPRDAVLQWADGIAQRYAALPAILLTHAYLHADNSRYDRLTRRDQKWNPHAYSSDPNPGAVNDGEEMWRKLISRNANILFVLCGHDLGDGVGRLISRRPDGTRVQQLLANFQMGPLGGAGYLRLMRFFPASRRVIVWTYSPYLGRFKTDPENHFDMHYDLPSATTNHNEEIEE
jgi:Calcineurin-like phosphoesterase